MKVTEKYNNLTTGIIAGILLPIITAFIMYLVAKNDLSPGEWLRKISDAGIVSKVITLSVIPNVFIFLIFNHFDMLRASRGVLGTTIAWAVLVFGEKLLV
ncbi:MAG: hypothetical protein H6R35_960 [Bacteroidetes bacterium]|nr:hypothetical protein [Bacteroidota bacterium]